MQTQWGPLCGDWWVFVCSMLEILFSAVLVKLLHDDLSIAFAFVVLLFYCWLEHGQSEIGTIESGLKMICL